jgi:serine/threonine protein kinase
VHTPPHVPGYVIRDVLGRGGFATVYLATQVAVGRDVAIKIDNRVLATDRDRRRFFREVHSAGQLSGHPHVIGLYDAGTLPDGRPYLVMELCTGGSLAEMLRERGGLAPDEVRDIGVRLADALGAAHQSGVLHRDLKPGNILINRYGMVGLADFGLASVITADSEQSATRESLTPAYAPPEAFALEEPTPRGDVYSFGATLYALLSGRPPRFPKTGSPSIATILRMHTEPVPILPRVPTPLMDVIMRALASDPAERYSDGHAMRDALTQVPVGGVAAGSIPGSASIGISDGLSNPPRPSQQPAPEKSPAPAQRPVQKPPPRRRTATVLAISAAVAVPVIALVFVILVLATGGFIFATQSPEDSDEGAPSSDTERSSPTATAGQRVAGVNYPVRTTTTGCPAASLGGRCVTDAECWSGMVVIVGHVTVERRPCEELHRWETFAIAPLPADALTSDQQALEAHPTVKKLCSMTVLLRSRHGSALRLPASQFQAAALPPSEQAYNDGVRVYRCVAAISDPNGDGTKGSVFV